jgi:hypothetical protein
MVAGRVLFPENFDSINLVSLPIPCSMPFLIDFLSSKSDAMFYFLIK